VPKADSFIRLSDGPTNSRLLSVSGTFAVFGPSTTDTDLYLCDRRYKLFGANWRRTCSSSNCSGTSTTLTSAAVAVAVSAAPYIKL